MNPAIFHVYFNCWAQVYMHVSPRLGCSWTRCIHDYALESWAQELLRFIGASWCEFSCLACEVSWFLASIWEELLVRCIRLDVFWMLLDWLISPFLCTIYRSLKNFLILLLVFSGLLRDRIWVLVHLDLDEVIERCILNWVYSLSVCGCWGWKILLGCKWDFYHFLPTKLRLIYLLTVIFTSRICLIQQLGYGSTARIICSRPLCGWFWNLSQRALIFCSISGRLKRRCSRKRIEIRR